MAKRNTNNVANTVRVPERDRREEQAPPVKKQTFAEFASDVQNFARYEAQRKNVQPESTYDQAIELIRGGGMQNQRAMASSPANRQFVAQQRERINREKRQEYLNELGKNYGYKRAGNQVVYVTPTNPLPKLTEQNRGTRANAPGAFGIQPAEYVGAMSAFDRFNKLQSEKPNTNPLDEKLTTEARGWVQGHFPEMYSAGKLPTYEDVVQKMQMNPAQQREIWNGYNTFAKELTDAEAVTTDAASRYAQEMDQAQRDRDEALRLLGAGAEKLATGRTADYYERYNQAYGAERGNGETEEEQQQRMLGIISARTQGEQHELMRQSEMTQKERDVYKTILGVYGEEEAKRYLDSLEGELNRRVTDAQTQRMQTFATEHPFVSSFIAPAQRMLGSINQGKGYVREAITGEAPDVYDLSRLPTRAADTMVGTVAQDIERKVDGFGGKALGFGYQTLMSIADMGTNMLALGPMAGVGMSLGAAASAYNDAVDRGADHQTATARAAVAGAAEMLFEKFSIEGVLKIAKGGGLGKAVLNVLRQAGIEASEEAATEVANQIGDYVLMGEESLYAQEGIGGVAKNVGLAALGGALSGGITGGGAQVYNSITQRNQQNEEGTAQSAQQSMRIEREVTGQRPAQEATTQPTQQPVRVEREVTGQRPAQETNAQPTQQPVRVEREVTGKRPTQEADVLQNAASEMMAEEQEAKAEKPAKTAENAKAGKPFRVEREVKVRRNGIEQSMTVTGVEEASNGSIFLRARNEDGETEIVSAADAEFVDPVQQELMNYRGITRMDPIGLRNYLDGYDASIATPEQYAQAYESAYMDGKAGFSYEHMRNMAATAAKFLTENIRQIAYAAGERQYLLNARSTRYQQMVTDALNKAAGGKIRFVDEDISENGYYDPKTGEIVISTNADKGAYAYIAVHELGHKLRAENETAWGSFKELVVDALLVNDVDIDERIASTKELYKQRGQDLTTEQALEEVICNSAAAILQDEQIVKDMVKKNRPLMERVADFLREFVDKLAKTITKAGEDMSGLGNWKQLDALKGDHENLQKIYQSLMSALEDTQKQENHSDAEDGMVRMSAKEERYDFSKPFGEQVKDWLAGLFPQKDTFVVGATPNVLKEIGFNDLPVTMDQKHVNHIVGKTKNADHNLEMTFLEKLPELIKKPLAIFENSEAPEDGVTMLLAFRNKNADDRPVIGVVNIKKGGAIHGMSLDANRLLTAHSRADITEKLQTAVAKEQNGEVAIYYLDKKSSQSFLEPGQSQVLDAFKKDGYIHSIQEKASPVNVASVEQTETQQFKRWFKNSKIRNSDGTAKTMYRGGGEEINIFDRRKSNYANLYGRGFYFTDSEAHAKQYGEARSYYLSVKNPLNESSDAKKITQEQMRNFLEAVADDEDYGLENYGYGATVDSVLESLSGKNDFDALQDVNATAIGDFVAAVELFNEVNGTDYDGIIAPTETVVFDSRQIKSATNNIGTFDPNNPDIRYSFRESSEAVQEELEQTADAFEQVRHGHSTTPAEAYDLAGKIIKEANSTFDRMEAAQEIARINDYIENAEVLDMEYVDDMQTRLMSRILEKSRVLDKEHEQLVDPIREYFKGTRIRLTDAQREEAANIAGSYGAYARSMQGRVKLSRLHGTELDALWPELHEMAPEWFPEDTAEGDMPRILMEAKDAIKPVYNTGMNTEEMASWMAGKLNDAYLNLPAVKAAARNQKGFTGSVKEMRAALKRFEETSAEEFKVALEAVRKSDKLKTASEREEHERAIMEKYRKLRERENAQRRATELRAKQRGRTEAFARTMLNWLDKPTDAKHIPAGLEEPLRDVLSALDFSGKNTKVATQLASRIEKLAEVLEGAQEGEDENRRIFLERDQQMLDELRRVAVLIRGNTEGRGVYDLNGLELKELNKWLGVVKHVLTGASKMRGSNFDVDVQQVAAESILEISQKKPMKDKKWITKQWEKYFAVDMMDSFTFFERLGRTSTRVFEGLREGFDQMARHVKQAETYTGQLLKDFDLKAVTGRKAKKQTFELESGSTIEMTRAQIMELYVLNKREQARGHIYGDGILVRGDEDAHAHAVTEQDVAKITSTLTEEEKKIADGMQKFLSKICAQWGNETSLKLLGYKKFGEENYWPISTDPNTRNTTRLEDNFAANISAIKNQGMTKQLIEGARNAIMIGDVFDTYTRHISNMAAYSAYAVPLSDFTRWYNSRGLKIEIAHTMGQKGLAYINNLLMAINGTAQKSPLTGPEKIAGVMARNAKTAAVGANLRVAIQQPTSYARAAMYINEKYLAAALGKKIKNAELVDKYCGIAAWKRYGFRETNIGPNLREMIVGDKSALEKGRELSMKLAEAGDNWTLNRLWVACELETNDLMPELEKGTEAYYQHVGKRMSEIVDRTQVVDSPFHRSQMMRSKSYLAQTLTNFMSEPTKTFNMLMGAVYDYADNRKNPAAKKRLAKTMVVYGVSTVLTAAAAGIVDAFRDSDDEKEWLEKYLDAVMGNALDSLNPLGMIPLVRDALSTLEGYDSNRLDQQSVQRIVWACQEMKKFADGESKLNIYGVAYKVAQALSSTLGIPLSNALRETNALIQTATGTSPTLNTEAQKASYINQLYAAMQKGDAKDQAKIRAKLRADVGLNPKEIDTAIAAKLSYDERIAKAYEAKKAGKIGDVNRAKNALAHEGFTGEMVDKAIADYGNRVDPKEKREKDMDAQLSARAYTYDEAMTAINAGASIADIKAMMSDMAADSTASDPEKSVRSELKGKIKQEYMAAWKKGDEARMNSLKTVLTDAIEMEEKEIDEWIVEQHRVDLRSAVDAYDSAAAKKAIAELRKAGKTDSNIKGSLDKYKQLYIDTMNAGDGQTAQKIKKMLMGLGLTGTKGKPLYTEDTFEGWMKK